jgi:hypothetical protein
MSMSDPQETPPPNPRREDRVQQAFDRAADGLGLRLEPVSAREGGDDVRIVGTAFVAFNKSIDYELMESPPPVGAADDTAITSILMAYETVSPADLAQNWRQYATDPHIAVADGWVAQVTDKTFRKWLRSDEYEEWTEEYPMFSPRHVQVTNLNIVYIGRVRAVVTYHLQEEFTNGTVAAGNGSASLFKLEGGQWRIVSIHKRVKEEVTP